MILRFFTKNADFEMLKFDFYTKLSIFDTQNATYDNQIQNLSITGFIFSIIYQYFPDYFPFFSSNMQFL